jgi:RNA 2',3'-cyclic 3'-phosphodiesterase
VTTRFVAIGVAPQVRRALEVAVAPLRERRPGLAWTDPLGWHVTLAFLGHLPNHELDRTVEVVRSEVTDGSSGVGSTLRLSIGSAARFASRVLVVEVDDDPAGRVAALGRHIQDALAHADLPVQERPVRAHVTLARARRGGAIDPAVVAEIQRVVDAAPDLGAWEPASIGVFSSHPRPDGPARYVMDAEVAMAH